MIEPVEIGPYRWLRTPLAAVTLVAQQERFADAPGNGAASRRGDQSILSSARRAEAQAWPASPSNAYSRGLSRIPGISGAGSAEPS